MSTYEKRGASSQKEDVHAAVSALPPTLFPGAFCHAVADPFDPKSDQVYLHHADGAGTKSSLAYLYWRETGDASVFRGVAEDAVVMNTDDLLCVGAVGNLMVSSTIGRNKSLIPGEILKEIISGTQAFLEKLNGFGVNAVLTGGETADVGDLVRTLIVDATVSTRLDQKDFLDASKIKNGQSIIGLASFGQTTYETSYNAGMGSNGLTSARHELFKKDYAQKYPESFDPGLPMEVVYTGGHALTDPLPGTPLDMGKAVLSPTRTYLPVMRKVFAECRSAISGVIHCTGGGQTKCLKFGRGIHYVKDDLFSFPPLFQKLAEKTPLREMFQVFNCGHRLEIICDPGAEKTILDIAKSFRLEARKIGRTEPSKRMGVNHLTIRASGEVFEY